MSVHCNLYCVTRAANNNCAPTLAGTGDSVYIFDTDDAFGTNGFPEPTGGLYGDDLVTSISGKCYKIDIKSNSGQVTSEKGEGSDFRQLTGTAVVDHSIDKFLPIDAAIPFKKIGVLIPCTSGADSTSKLYYVIMSKYKKVKYSSNFDSGTTYDSDHGFTITFTVSPVTSACPVVRIATNANLQKSSSGSFNVTPTSLSMDTTTNKTKEITADKTITNAESSNNSIVTAAVSGGKITVTAVSNGNAEITVYAGELTAKVSVIVS